ncbi:hypothetical protein CONPUDRAFT_143860 [Coniophora puteana RWD-64-598 SS2]|uniref:Uncharacterized protein n=1 Tax=Coniophora puteana (strain RWD-64-598) TaxID=741705 RepID=A0A5M3MU10_CONPW|nr:uncharacterized protein CONPUDRAFT_143860 [Coniophora puteana RWD-64-598 SS2]EIW82520.1 hypothetical protein CONPUDRAFT_143860 [Coniophora puteana RWD-64-598 SS2]
MPRALKGLDQELPLTHYFGRAKEEDKSLTRSSQKRHRPRMPEHAEPSHDYGSPSGVLTKVTSGARNSPGKRRGQARTVETRTSPSSSPSRKKASKISSFKTSNYKEYDVIDLTRESSRSEIEVISSDVEEMSFAPLAAAREDSGAGHSLVTPPPTERRSIKDKVTKHRAIKSDTGLGKGKGKARAALPTPQTTVRRAHVKIKKALPSAETSSKVDVSCASDPLTGMKSLIRPSYEFKSSASTTMPERTPSVAPSVVHEHAKDQDFDNPFIATISPVVSRSPSPIQATDIESPELATSSRHLDLPAPSDNINPLIPSSQSQYLLSIHATPSKKKGSVDSLPLTSVPTMSWTATSQSIEEGELDIRMSPRALKLYSLVGNNVAHPYESREIPPSATPSRSPAMRKQHQCTIQGDHTPKRSMNKSAFSSPVEHGKRYYTMSPSGRLAQEDDTQAATNEAGNPDELHTETQTETESESDTEFMGFVTGLGEDHGRRKRSRKESNKQTQPSEGYWASHGTPSQILEGSDPDYAGSVATEPGSMPSLVRGFLGIFD